MQTTTGPDVASVTTEGSFMEDLVEFLDRVRFATSLVEVNIAAGLLYEALQHTQLG